MGLRGLNAGANDKRDRSAGSASRSPRWNWITRTGAPRSFTSLTVLCLVALIAGCGSARPPVTVGITEVSSSPALQPGSSATITVTGLNAAVDLSITSITFAPAAGGSDSEVNPTAQTPLTNGQVTLTFKVPALSVSSPTKYQVSIGGQTVLQQGFRSSAPFSVEIDPASTLTSVTPSIGAVGQTLTVAIVAVNSSFVQGQTQATFGAGIAVNGAGEGLPANITVTSATTATASLVIDSAAAAGPRTVTVTTGDQTASLASGFTVEASVLPLVASAGGPYTGNTGSPVAFNASGSSDPNAATLSYAWNFGDGSTGSGATPTHTYAKAGTFTVTLTLSDTDGLTASATTTATITAIAPPVAVPGGPYAGAVNQPIALNGSGSTDPNGSALTYAWTFGDGGAATGAAPSHTYTAVGSYKATLTVTDALGQTASASATVTVTAASQKPTAAPGGPYTGTVGQLITFSGAASVDPNNLSLSYAWDFGDGTVGSGATTQHAYSIAGTYAVKLTVSDSTGQSDTEATTAAITAATAGTPVANAGGPYTGAAGQAVQFNGAASSDPKGETLTYAWTFGDGGTATGAEPAYTYQSGGAFNVTLTVTNTDGLSASANTTATITGSSAQLAAVENGPYTGNVNQQISFDSSSSTGPTGDALTYNWTFGDNATATGAQVTHAYTQAGSYAVTLTVVDGVNQASTTAPATITQPPDVQILTPAQGALFNTTSVTVTGTVGSTVQSVSVNGTAATLSGTSFTVSVPVREGMNIITAVGTDATGNSGTASTSVTIDLTPPIVSILQPLDTSTVTSQQVTVAGMVTDQVTGTVNANNVTVTVNGQAATVSNRSFALNGLVLVPGTNTVTVVATDTAGNVSQSIAHVSYTSVAAQQHVVILSGNNQSGTINSILPQPLAVQLVTGTGSPIPNRLVAFTVTASDGIIESLPQQGQTLTLTTDTTGKASVLFQLGSRAGLGINQVSVTSPGFLGNAVFTETTTAGTPAFIHEFLGNNQRGIIGQPLAQAFQTIVQDAGGNPIASVPVTFTVTAGDGTLNGQQTTYTASTDSDGRAMATLTLGEQEGINNNTVTADFANDPNSSVEFYASGYASGPPAATSVSGIVMDNAGNVVPNATARLQNTNLSTATDVNGHFVINGAPVGTVTLLIDGSTTTLAETLPSLTFVMQDLPGQNNTLNAPIYLPIIDTQSAQTAGGDQPVTLTLAGMPGVALTIAPNSVTFPDGSHVGQVTLSQVKSDLVPMPPPNGVPPAFAWTIQPAGTKFSVPATITIPNTDGLPPGQVQEFYQYDHDLEQFVSVGTLRVSPDGSVLNSDPGFGITKAGWCSPGANPPPPSCGHSCNDNNPCTNDSAGPNCTCKHTATSGGSCGGAGASSNSCYNPGVCKNGSCSGQKKPDGSGCNDNLYCTNPDQCKGGACVGKPKAPMPLQASDTSLANAFVQGFNALGQALQVASYFGAGSTGLTIDGYTLSLDTATGQEECCEQMKGQYKASVTIPIKSKGSIKGSIPIPDTAVVVPGTDYKAGFFFVPSFTLTGTVPVTFRQCDNKVSATGSIKVEGGFGLQWAVNFPTPFGDLDTSATASTGIYGNFQPMDSGIGYSFGYSALTFAVKVKQTWTGFNYNLSVPAPAPFNGGQIYPAGTGQGFLAYPPAN